MKFLNVHKLNVKVGDMVFSTLDNKNEFAISTSHSSVRTITLPYDKNGLLIRAFNKITPVSLIKRIIIGSSPRIYEVQ
jgi:hypothetical protein